MERPPTWQAGIYERAAPVSTTEAKVHDVRIDPRALTAASNNADWCDLVCRAEGIATSISDGVWATHRRSPPLHPDAITLTPTASADAVLARVEPGDGCSVKDSFASLDLGRLGFRVLFDAEWIYLSRPSDTVDTLRWRATSDFPAWRHIPGPVFDDPSVCALVARCGDEVVAGVIANRSAEVVGLSNLVVLGHDVDEVWTSAVGAVSARFPGLPLVGYELGASLEAARDAGFASVGPLRVWFAGA
jgi:hypothetical protein